MIAQDRWLASRRAQIELIEMVRDEDERASLRRAKGVEGLSWLPRDGCLSALLLDWPE